MDFLSFPTGITRKLPTWIAAEVSEGGREDQLGGVLAEDESLCIGRFARDLRRRRADLQW